MSEDGNKRLGRGLSALLGEESEDYAALDQVRASKEVPVEFLRPNPYQPRHRFDQSALQSLVDSVKEKGILQPILVRRLPDEANAYEIVAGERRWRAAQAAGLHQIPVLIRELNDQDSLEIALIENLQRQDLTPVEEALGYQRLIDEFTYTQEQLAKGIGKSRSQVANMLRLLSLPDEVKEMLDDGRLTAGHARALVTSEDPLSLARQIIAGGFTVRQAEQLTKRWSGRKKRKDRSEQPAKDADTIALEGDLSAALGLKVTVHHHGETGGEVRIAYRTLEQLDEICRRLCHQVDGEQDDLEEEPFVMDSAMEEETLVEGESDEDLPNEEGVSGTPEASLRIVSDSASSTKTPLDINGAWNALTKEDDDDAGTQDSKGRGNKTANQEAGHGKENLPNGTAG